MRASSRGASAPGLSVVHRHAGTAASLSRPIVDPRERPVAAEQLEGVEQWRGHRAAGDGDPDRREEVAGLHPQRLGRRAAPLLEDLGAEVRVVHLGQNFRGAPQRGSRLVRPTLLGVEELRGVPAGNDLVRLPYKAEQLGRLGQLHEPLAHQRNHAHQVGISDHLRDPRAQAQGQLLVAQRANVDAVEVVEAALVEDRATLVHLGHVEPPDKLVEGEDLLLGARRPAEEGEEVSHRLGQVALLAVGRHGRLALALADLGAVGVEDERNVTEARLPVAQGTDERDVLRGVRQVVLAADHVGDLHGLVVDHHHEVIQGYAIGADDHEVTQQAVVEVDLATDQVVEADDLGLHLEANDRWPSRPRTRRAPYRSGSSNAGCTAAAPWPLPADGGRPPAPRACTSTDTPRRSRAAAAPLAHRGPFAGSAGTVRVADVLALGDLRPLVPADAEPVEVVDDVPLELCRASRNVGVLDAQDIGASHVPGGEEVVERGARRPDVEWPRGTGRHAHAGLLVHAPMLAADAEG